MKSKFAIRQSLVSSLAVATFGSPAIGLADDTFQAEGGLNYSRFSEVGSRYEWIQGQATYYFDKLPTSPKDYPLDQAQFVERIGSVSAGYGQSSQTADNVKELRRGSMYSLAVDFRLPDQSLMAFASYGSFYDGKREYLDANPAFVAESSSDSYELDVGAYIGKTTLLVLGEYRNNSRSKSTSSFGTSESKSTSNTTSLTLQHLEKFPGRNHAAFYAGISQTATANFDNSPSTKSSAYFLGGTYYPTKMTGLNFGFQADNGDGKVGSSDDEIYSLGAKTFVTPTASVSLDYSRTRMKYHYFSGSEYSYSFHSISLGASKRF